MLWKNLATVHRGSGRFAGRLSERVGDGFPAIVPVWKMNDRPDRGLRTEKAGRWGPVCRTGPGGLSRGWESGRMRGGPFGRTDATDGQKPMLRLDFRAPEDRIFGILIIFIFSFTNYTVLLP